MVEDQLQLVARINKRDIYSTSELSTEITGSLQAMPMYRAARNLCETVYVLFGLYSFGAGSTPIRIFGVVRFSDSF